MKNIAPGTKCCHCKKNQRAKIGNGRTRRIKNIAPRTTAYGNASRKTKFCKINPLNCGGENEAPGGFFDEE
jgi:hypothetical protein